VALEGESKGKQIFFFSSVPFSCSLRGTLRMCVLCFLLWSLFPPSFSFARRMYIINFVDSTWSQGHLHSRSTLARARCTCQLMAFSAT
jgi:hypothetical protein